MRTYDFIAMHISLNTLWRVYCVIHMLVSTWRVSGERTYLEPALTARMFIRVASGLDKERKRPACGFPERRGLRIDKVNYPSINRGGHSGQLIAHPLYSNLLRVHNYANISIRLPFSSFPPLSRDIVDFNNCASWARKQSRGTPRFFPIRSSYNWFLSDFIESQARFVHGTPVRSQLMSGPGPAGPVGTTRQNCSFVYVHCLRPRGCQIRRWSIHNRSSLGTHWRKAREQCCTTACEDQLPLRTSVTRCNLLSSACTGSICGRGSGWTNIEHFKTYKSGAQDACCRMQFSHPLAAYLRGVSHLRDFGWLRFEDTLCILDRCLPDVVNRHRYWEAMRLGDILVFYRFEDKSTRHSHCNARVLLARRFQFLVAVDVATLSRRSIK